MNVSVKTVTCHRRLPPFQSDAVGKVRFNENVIVILYWYEKDYVYKNLKVWFKSNK